MIASGGNYQYQSSVYVASDLYDFTLNADQFSLINSNGLIVGAWETEIIEIQLVKQPQN